MSPSERASFGGFLCDFVFALDVSKVDARGKPEGNMWTFFMGNRSF